MTVVTLIVGVERVVILASVRFANGVVIRVAVSDDTFATENTFMFVTDAFVIVALDKVAWPDPIRAVVADI